ncbi:uncharacterized protein [Paramormyrops kingsleyae]|uniref:uncharacterized protein isoform X2 n=1 Tax=Paramormyrops kingsleyae TaxID=1676925 RepID=UPI003B97405C
MERLAGAHHPLVILAVAVAGSSALAHKVMEGDQVTLPCRYSVQHYGQSRVCWGRGCGALWCSGAILQMDGSRVISKASEKYRLTGNLRLGRVDLTIANISRTDGGPYCCRVDINGYFNDMKVLHTIRVTQVTPFPAPTGIQGEKSDSYTDRYPDTEPLPLLEEYTLNPRSNHPKAGSIERFTRDVPSEAVWQVENPVTSSGRFRPGDPWKTIYTLWTRRTKGTAGGERSQHGHGREISQSSASHSETLSAVIFFLGEHAKGLYFPVLLQCWEEETSISKQ